MKLKEPTNFNQLESTQKMRVMFEAGYQTGYEIGLEKGANFHLDSSAFSRAKTSKPTLVKKVVKYTCYSWPILLIAGCYTFAFWRDSLDRGVKYNRQHSALGVLYAMRTDGMPIQESQDDPIPLLEE